MNALLVEDEALVAMIAEEALTVLGFSPRSVATAAEALQAFEQQAPKLAVIDVGLPDGRGDDLARRLRALDPDLAIVVASGYDAEELRANFAGDARVQVVAKPYTESDLDRAAKALGFAGLD